MNATSRLQPIELGHDDRALVGGRPPQRRLELRPALERIRALRGLNLGEGLGDGVALGRAEALDRGFLRVQAKAGLALLLGADTDRAASEMPGAAALVAAIESMEGDLVLGGLELFVKDKASYARNRTRIAESGRVPLVVALVAYEGGTLMQVITMIEMPRSHVTSATTG